MMRFLYILPICLFLNTQGISACNCPSKSEAFSFLEYEQAAHIVEVHIIEKIENNQPTAKAPALDLSQLYTITLLQEFKGKTEHNKELKVYLESSCAFVPELGQSYVLYLSKSSTGHLEIRNICARFLKSNHSLYQAEKKILSALNAKKNSHFAPTLKLKGTNYSPFSGTIKNGQRTGTWVIKELNAQNKVIPVVKIKYRQGTILHVKKLYQNLFLPPKDAHYYDLLLDDLYPNLNRTKKHH